MLSLSTTAAVVGRKPRTAGPGRGGTAAGVGLALPRDRSEMYEKAIEFTLASHFDEIVRFVEEARSAGGVVFVHCGAGISRAPTSTCAYVMWKLRMPAADAIKLVRAARPCTRPNVGFVAALKAYEARLLDQQSAAPAPS